MGTVKRLVLFLLFCFAAAGLVSATGIQTTGGGGVAVGGSITGGLANCVLYADAAGTSLDCEAGFEYNETTNTLTVGLISAATSIVSPIFSSNAADPADSGLLRLGNAEEICWENSPTGTDVCINFSDLGGSPIDTTGAGIWGITGGAPDGSLGSLAAATADRVYVFAFTVTHAIVTTKVTLKSQANGAAGCNFNIGLYDSTGAIVVEGTAADCAAWGAVGQTITYTSTTLQPGLYYFAFTTDDVTAALTRSFTVTNHAIDVINTAGNFVGFCTNTSSNGDLPATCGAITASNAVTSWPVAYFTK